MPATFSGNALCIAVVSSVLALSACSSSQTQPDRKNLNGAGAGVNTMQAPMIRTLPGWYVEAAFTVGDEVEGYQPPGILDGIGALALDHRVVRVLVNHELEADAGYSYKLANGTMLTGARVSYFDFHRTSRKLINAGLAFDKILNRAGEVVDDPSDLELDGLNRLCSSALFEAGTFNLVDDIYFAGEEADGGTEYALDVDEGALHAAPWLGRAGWENLSLLQHPDPNKVAVLVGDDRKGAPLWLYIGRKSDGEFLQRNGLAKGKLYVWVADNGDLSPEDLKGTGESRAGTFIEIAHYDDPSDGVPSGFDALGFADQDTQDRLAAAKAAFKFSRPEDVSTNPKNSTQAVLASTGRGDLFPSDNWGTVYLIDVDFSDLSATVEILYDSDDAGDGQFDAPDFGLRSPDNLDWADNGMIYIQEDRSTIPASLFGGTSGEETSLWELDPAAGRLTRIGQVDRTAIPTGQTDTSPADIGNWETSGILDVTSLFKTKPGETLLIAGVQAHSLRDGVIESDGLVQGGQLVLLSTRR